MPEYQTTVQDATAILRGSAMLELSAYAASPSYLDVGTLSGLEVTEVMEVNKEENDNADADELVTKQEMTIKANLHEAANSAVWAILRSTFDTVTTVAAAEVAGATYVFAANTTVANLIYELPGQNDSGSVQTITTVVKTGPTTLTAGDDYISAKTANGKWGLLFIAGGAYDATAAMTVTYTYTPSASKTTKSGDKTVIPWFIARITTKNDGNAFVTTCYKCKITKGREWKYPKDDDTDRRVKVPIEIICKADSLYNSSYVYAISQEGGI
jgi:hypothetical protein